MTWAIAHGQASLAIHAALGLALVVFVVGTAAHAIRLRRRAITLCSVLAGLLVIGAGFNGASFLDFGNNVSSLITALLAFGAIACYTLALFLSGQPPLRQ